MAKKYHWEHFSEQQLLDTRLCDLGLSLQGHWVQKEAKKLYTALARRGLNFKPHLWIGDEWFSPDGVPGIAVPFFILHPRLAALEQKMVGDVEGGNPIECQKLLRHECGHAIDNAFKLRLSKRRQRLFGKSSIPYPDHYEYKAHSKNYVRHFKDHYAQAHPDEDWAETFAVWMGPKVQWRSQYANWPALDKLEFLDEIMNGISGKRPLTQNKLCLYTLADQKITLRQYYKVKRKRFGMESRDFYGRDLRRIFKPASCHTKVASATIQALKPKLKATVARRSGHPQYFVETMLKTLEAEIIKHKLEPISQAQMPRQIEKLLVTQSHRFKRLGRHRINM